MKKLIATAVAAGALAVAGTASAQDIGGVIANILGFGQPTYNQPYGYGNPGYAYGGPAVVAPQTQIYQDQYGRQFYYDQYGRQVYTQAQNYNQQPIVGYDQWGRPVYGNAGTYAYGGSTWDRDLTASPTTATGIRTTGGITDPGRAGNDSSRHPREGGDPERPHSTARTRSLKALGPRLRGGGERTISSAS